MFQHALAYVIAVLSAEKDEEKGATAVEYALVVAGIAVLLVGAVAVFGQALDGFFRGLGGKVGLGGSTPAAGA
jgi:pilus assembly protein Flp/PilA